MKTNFNFIENFDALDESQFNKLIRENDAPFIKYPFLKALENSGCVGRELGWAPKHLVKSNKNVISGFLPMYIKNNSCLLYTSPSPRDGLLSRMPSSA